ncbi:MAG: hypothetical protein ACODAU_00385 [Myxococcota bacterium]
MRRWAVAFGLSFVLVAGTASAQHDEIYDEAGEGAEELGVDTDGPPDEVGHGEHEASAGDVFRLTNYEFWGPVVNFLAVLLIVVAFAGPKVRSYLVERRREIAQGLDEAQRLKAEAEAKYEEYATRLDKLDQEMERIRQEMIKAGEAERDRIVAEAEAKAARMRRETGFVIEQQMKQLREDLTREAVQAAVDAAEKVLKEKITADDQQRLAEQYLEIVGQEVKASLRSAHAPAPAPEKAAAEGGQA